MAKKNNEVLDATQSDAVEPETEAADAATELADAAPDESGESPAPAAQQKPSEQSGPPIVTSAVSTIEDDLDDEPLDDVIVARARALSRRRGIFIVLFIVVVVAIGVFFALQSGMLQGACAGLEPGIHKLDDGTKLNCS